MRGPDGGALAWLAAGVGPVIVAGSRDAAPCRDRPGAGGPSRGPSRDGSRGGGRPCDQRPDRVPAGHRVVVVHRPAADLPFEVRTAVDGPMATVARFATLDAARRWVRGEPAGSAAER